MSAILNSGGAIGADTLFGECAERVGHEVRHYAFEGMKTEWGCHLKTLNAANLYQADEYLVQANKTLKRHFPTRSEYVNNLLRRNYYQIKDTKIIYVVAPLADDNKIVQGGTGWAVQMAVDRMVLLIYLFDLKSNKWYEYFHAGNIFEYILFVDIIKPVDLQCVYTGIGSRELNSDGKKAIKELYNI